MRMRSIRAAWKELREEDPRSALGLTTLYRLVSDGTIPSTRVGKNILIDMDRLDDYLTGEHQGSVSVAGAIRPVGMRQ